MSRVTLNGRVVADEDQWIYDWFGIDAFSPAVIRKAVEDNPAGEDLTLEINSGGGSVFAGFEMYSILKGAKCQTIAEVQSLAASAASTAMVGCSKVMLSPVAQVMIHLPSSYAEGNQEDMERERRALESITQSILNGYELKCREKTDRAHLEELMYAESWLSAQEAVDLGLADGILFQNEDDSSTLPANIINAVGGGIRSLACNSGAPVSPAALKAQYEQLVRNGATPADGHPVATSPQAGQEPGNPSTPAGDPPAPTSDDWQRKARLAIENNRFL